MPDMVFECVPYHDVLLKNMNVKQKRKDGVCNEMFQSYWPTDYDGLLDEWKAREERT